MRRKRVISVVACTNISLYQSSSSECRTLHSYLILISSFFTLHCFWKMSSHSRSRSKTSSSKSKSSSRREHRCHTCDRVFSRSDNLRTHQRLHSGERPFDCKYCGQSFRWVGALRTHEAKHVRDGHTVGNAPPIIKKRTASHYSKHGSRQYGSTNGSFILSEEDLIDDISLDGPWHDVLDDGFSKYR